MMSLINLVLVYSGSSGSVLLSYSLINLAARTPVAKLLSNHWETRAIQLTIANRVRIHLGSTRAKSNQEPLYR